MSRSEASFLEALDARHRPRVARILTSHGFSDDEAGDVWNRVLVAAWKAGASPAWFRDDAHEAFWVRSMVRQGVRYARLMRGRARYRMQAREFSQFEKEGMGGVVAFVSFLAASATAASAGEVPWQDRTLLAAWEATPPKQRRAIDLVVLQGLGFGEAGRLVGTSGSVIWKQVQDGFRGIRKRYAQGEAA